MLTKIEKAGLRARLFRHLDGIVTAPTAFALHKKGVLAYLLEQKSASLSDLTAKFQANEGYLNVALRVLCSQGWLSQTIDNQTDKIKFVYKNKSTLSKETKYFKKINNLHQNFLNMNNKLDNELINIIDDYKLKLFYFEPTYQNLRIISKLLGLL